MNELLILTKKEDTTGVLSDIEKALTDLAKQGNIICLETQKGQKVLIEKKSRLQFYKYATM
jgi:hypothetical protein